MYKVQWKKLALDNLDSLQKKIAIAIRRKVDAYIAIEPKKNGKPLKGELKGLWAGKHAKLRIIYEIFESTKTINIIDVDYRKGIYDK